MNATFVSEGYVRHEHRQELESGDELIVAAEAWVEIATIKNFSVIAISQPLQRHRCSLHVLEQRFELLALALRNPTLSEHSKS
jgi:hypothetical protein